METKKKTITKQVKTNPVSPQKRQYRTNLKGKTENALNRLKKALDGINPPLQQLSFPIFCLTFVKMVSFLQSKSLYNKLDILVMCGILDLFIARRAYVDLSAIKDYTGGFTDRYIHQSLIRLIEAGLIERVKKKERHSFYYVLSVYCVEEIQALINEVEGACARD